MRKFLLCALFACIGSALYTAAPPGEVKSPLLERVAFETAVKYDVVRPAALNVVENVQETYAAYRIIETDAVDNETHVSLHVDPGRKAEFLYSTYKTDIPAELHDRILSALQSRTCLHDQDQNRIKLSDQPQIPPLLFL